MNEKTFWQLVEQNKKKADTDDGAEVLVELLSKRTVDDIIEFERFMFQYMSQAYRNDLWLACGLLNDGYDSDDTFKDFRSYLISNGEEFFKECLRDPDGLADMIPLDVEAQYEAFQYAASRAYENKTGSYFQEDEIDITSQPDGFVLWETTSPAGDLVTIADAARVLPRLKRRFDEKVKSRIEESVEQYEIGVEEEYPPDRIKVISFLEHLGAFSVDAVAVLKRIAKDDESNNVRTMAQQSLKRLESN